MTKEDKKQPVKNIAICTPIGRFADPDYMTSVFKTMKFLDGHANVSWFTQVGHANLPRARNILTGQALKWGADDIIFIDDDIGWEPEALLKLMHVPEKVLICAGAPQRRTEELSFCGGPDNNLQWDCGEGRVIYSGYAATAFLRVKREAFEALADKVETFSYTGTDYKAFFNYKIGPNPSGKEVGFIGEDYYFSMLAKDNDVEVWIDPTIELRHWNRSPLTEVLVNHVKPKESKDDAIGEIASDSDSAGRNSNQDGAGADGA